LISCIFPLFPILFKSSSHTLDFWMISHCYPAVSIKSGRLSHLPICMLFIRDRRSGRRLPDHYFHSRTVKSEYSIEITIYEVNMEAPHRLALKIKNDNRSLSHARDETTRN
jgi:hypothetical protein